MRKILVVCSLSLGVFSCAEVAQQDSQTELDFKRPEEIHNPNGDSELAILMRNMHHEAFEIRKALVDGENPDLEKLNDLVKRIKEAQATDNSMKGESFDTFADHFQNQTLMLPEGSVEAFNNVMDACVSCHQTTCPGPIGKINKLKI